MIFILAILSIFFGGAFNNFFAVDYVDETKTTSFMKFDPNWSLFPKSFFTLFLFFPFFAPSQLLQPFINHLISGDRYGEYYVFQITDFHYFQWQTISNTFVGYENSWRWNILWIDPPMFIIVFGLLGSHKSNSSKI